MRRRARAHPRSRGENCGAFGGLQQVGGSSPLTRGKRGEGESAVKMERLIPAHAGKTPKSTGARMVNWAHPRSRGENTPHKAPSPASPGSSPLTRGKRAMADEFHYTHGLIPAHAGKTPRWCRRRRGARAHPRSRGENILLGTLLLMLIGSSPLTRGKRSRRPSGPLLGGLIPAHAGKTPPWMRRARASRAHPRSRGENSLMFW